MAAWVGFSVVLTVLFLQPLAGLVSHALQYDLHSHTLLVPFIAGYLLYTQRDALPPAGARSIRGAGMLGLIALAALSGVTAWRGSLSVNDDLALRVLAYVSLLAAGGFWFQGARWMAAAAFPFAFLIFMVPLPDAAVYWLETASKLASAEAAAWYFALAGTPLVRSGTIFELPGITIEVSQECSGIRSSWVLFITSVLASHMFLRSPWRRFLLVAFVIPLGVLRNGFRVLVVGLLCVHVGPQMIDSIIHHRGGPIFFLLSLIPLFLLLWWLRRQEDRAKP